MSEQATTSRELELLGDVRASTRSISRRGFLQDAGALSAVAVLQRLTPAFARTPTGLLTAQRTRVGHDSLESGDGPLELLIQETSITIGDRRAVATTINGTLPGPLLRFREGGEALLHVRNRLSEDTSLHWHGVLVPNAMDGVPGVNFAGIRSGETFTYQFPLRQYGTYWYHSHSGLQEQTGVYGPLIIDPAEPEPFAYDREFVVMLSDWSFESPYTILDKLKKQSDYYNVQRRTMGDFFRDVQTRGLRATIQDRLMWGKMRMTPVDISDIMAPAYQYLLNGQPPEQNWTALFHEGERVRLRFINAGAGSNFDVRIPGLEMTVVQVSGQHVQPVKTDEFRIAIAETYDVLVQPAANTAYTIFAESVDRSGYARGTLAPRPGMAATIPKLRPRPVLTMADMGMAMDMPGMSMGAGNMAGMETKAAASRPKSSADTGAAMPSMRMSGRGATGHDSTAAAKTSGDTNAQRMPTMVMSGHDAPSQTMPNGPKAFRAPGTIPEPVMHGPDHHRPGNTAVPMETRSRLHEPGPGLGNDGWRVLVYTDLRSLRRNPDALVPPTREIEFHLTGNMDRFMWSIDGMKYSESPAHIAILRGQRTRITMVNDTMMAHPMHLHGMWMELENGTGADIPRVHTINVKPADRVSVLVTPDERGPWAFHCHVLLHMELGMFRVLHVAETSLTETSE